jgi:exopolyphosphatase/guanosine-5'-triphosphate,3'-diphosphate pyrophosphatase
MGFTMAIHTFAAIYIGSYEVSMKIYELSSKKKMRSIDYVRSRLELGRDTYSKGTIDYELVDTLCDTLSSFTRIMKEYRVEAYEAYASAAVRDAENQLFIIDQIRIRTALHVNVLSNSDHRFISYKSVAVREEFEGLIKEGAAIVDVGGGGLQITIFSKGQMVTTQHMVLGTIRMRELFGKSSDNLSQYELQIEEMVNKQLNAFKAMYLEGIIIKNLIVIGDYISDIVERVEKQLGSNMAEVSALVRYIDKLKTKSLEQIAEELGKGTDRDALIIPYMMICKCIAKEFGAEQLWAPGIIISDGIACEYAERNHIYKMPHDFEADVLSEAMNISKRYMSYTPHIEALVEMSSLIFDSMKKVHGLGKREKLLLKISALLHDCGKYISFSNSPACSHDIIMSSDIIGLSRKELNIVANTVFYNYYDLDQYEDVSDELDQESFVLVAKLSAILRVASAMDRSHKQKFHNVKVALKGKELIISIETMEDLALEKSLFESKTEFFAHVFSIKPVLRIKR